MNAIELINKAESGARRGHVAELLVAADLTGHGFAVSFTAPYIHYDLLAERENWFYRVQVKCAYQSGQRWRFRTSRGNGTTGNKDYADTDLDLFAIVVPDPLEPLIVYLPNVPEYRGHLMFKDDHRMGIEECLSMLNRGKSRALIP